ncbi:hypothetical protein Q9S36_40540 [Microbacterium sp. ARD31]|uniref:hypothetical protein n=1 Tax=Microbacterium sp. ARD31 TaxID=2962576 RepID=UPI00288277E5|nr:hypothetical protein [Microbacterium sp. ARD31]MDT0186492.1 hypothetical protein [Microbacterium sp. ARD31]
MSGTPRRRHSPAVYRRRRLLFVVVLLAIVLGIWLLIAQPWRGAAAETDGPTVTGPSLLDVATSLPIPQGGTGTAEGQAADDGVESGADDGETDAATDAEATPSPVAEPVAEPCAARDITVEAVADKGAYPTGENPQLSIRLTNDGVDDCIINVGTTTQVFTITSGEDTWWRSTDCQDDPSDMFVTLAAGQSVESAEPLEWDRTRSSVDSCGRGDRARAPGSGSTYWLEVEIAGIPAIEAISFQLY